MPEGYRIRKTQWGYTLFHPSGRAVAHAETRSLVMLYAREVIA